jgi:hypothetical protein
LLFIFIAFQGRQLSEKIILDVYFFRAPDFDYELLNHVYFFLERSQQPGYDNAAGAA